MENKKNKWITFAIICLTTGVITELPYMRWQLYEPLREFLGQNNTQFGMSASLFGLLSMILYIPGGWVADRFSHKILFTVSSIGCGLLGFWLAAAPGFTSVMIIHGLWSITNIGLFWPTMTKAIALLEDSQGQGKVFGYFEGVRGIFVVVMWLGLMQVFEHMGGMRMVIIVMSILAILSGILSFFFMPDNKDAEAASSGTILKDMGAALKYPVTWLCAGTILCVYSVYNASSYMQAYCQEVLGMTAVVAGYVGILRKELEETQKSIGENRSRRNVLRDTIADFQQKLRQQYVEQNTAKMNLEQLKEKEGEIQNSYRQIDREQEELRHQAGEIRQDHSSIARELEDSQKDEKELETFIETKQKELEEWKAEETEKTHELEKIRLEESSLEQQNQFLQENLSRLNSEIAAFQKESQEITENLVQSREEIHKKEEGIQELKNAAQECLLKEEQYGSQRAQCQEEKEKRSASHKTFFEKRDYLSEKTSLLDKECFRLRSQTEKIEEQREGQISYMWEEYEITPNNALQYRKEELTDRQAIKADVTRIKDEIRKLGSVNVNAIEDYKELLERHTFLSGQYDDIVKAEETLEGIILELDEGMRKQFTEKFRDIQREFDKTFKELFGGGKGTLELAEDEDILEAGIRIISQPPGKKLQNMMQLSGGEKALTAIALLFAIQNLKPSPFCLLDEIEAALDDSNVGRFASYLQKLTKNTQFIIITHRRGTMNAADRLYGITMQEKGVSTLVSVDLVENQLSK